MRLGPRVGLVTTLLMAAVLAASGGVFLRFRRAELQRELERQARDLARALAVGIEPLSPEGSAAALEARIAWANAQNGHFRLEAAAGIGKRPNNFWAGLVDEASTLDAPAGRLYSVGFLGDERPIYAMAVPLHSALPGDPARQTVVFLGLVRDCGYIDDEVAAAAGRMLPLLGAGVLVFGVLVRLLLMTSVVRPLRRLLDGIDAVAKGDLSRAVLPQRDDEIGSLAGRFNAMTESLRTARAEEARANGARLALETQLRHSEKLATMGQMAAEIAHEVGTPLNVIGGRARSLAKRAGEPAEVQKNADIIAAQVERITKIIRQVLDFSRKSHPTLTQVDVARVVAEALDFIGEAGKRQRVRIDVRTAPELPPIPGSPGEIQQVVLNLLSNALHAMPTGGTLNVAVDQVTRRKEGLALAPPSPYLMLQVSDTGTGVPPADREKIFEAFFTTKDTGEGTGLGLAVAKGIVKDHDGWIEVDGPPGGGAVFRVFLPLGGSVGDADDATASGASSATSASS